MFLISWAWHGLVLNDLSELRSSLRGYLLLTGVAYLFIGGGLTWLVHRALARSWISLRSAFVWKGMALGAGCGLVVYLVVYLSGLSFASHEWHHVLLDLLWQAMEQALGGLLACLGIIYDVHRQFMETERVR
jgi:hypothetical protein